MVVASKKSTSVKPKTRTKVVKGHCELKADINGEWLQDWRFLAYKGNGQANQPLLFIGSTGTGKSFMANGLFFQCAEMGDICIMPGDTAFEARHFINYISDKVKMKVLVPNTFKYDFQVFDIDKQRMKITLETICEHNNIELIVFDPLKDNINKYLEPFQILVVLDCCYTLPSRTKFWTFIMKQIKLRKRYAVDIVTYLFHEFGTYFPVISFKDQFKYVDEFAQQFVEFRKFYMRGICLEQFPGQSYWKMEPQFEVRVTKGSNAGRSQKYDRKYGRGKQLNQFSVVWGGIEDVRQTMIGTFHELKQIWKIIPEEEIEFKITEEENKEEQTDVISIRDIQVYREIQRGTSQSEIGSMYNLTQQRISQIGIKLKPFMTY